MVDVSFKLDASNALAAMKRVSAVLGNLRPAMVETARFIEREVQQSFINQRDPYGQRWLPLKDSTLRLRRRRGNNSSVILEDSGEMRDSLVVVPGSNSVSVQMDDFSGIHQAGNPANRMFGKAPAPIPQRRIFPIIDDNVVFPTSWDQEITSIVEDLIEATFNGRS